MAIKIRKRRVATPNHTYPKGFGGAKGHTPELVREYIIQWSKLNGPYKPTKYIVAGQEIVA